MSQSIKQRFAQIAFEKKIPVGAFIVVTERCHLRCQQCYLVENPRPELSTKELCDAIDQLAEAGTFAITLTGGEPLLRPDIYQLINYANQKNINVTMFTTATSCNPQRAKKLAGAGLFLASTSIYAAIPEIHDEITQIPGSLQKTIDGMRELARAGIRTEIKFLQMTTNVGQLQGVRAIAEELGATFSIDFGITVCHDGRREPLQMQVQEDLHLQVQLQLAKEDPLGLGQITPNPGKMDKPMCGAGHSRVVVGTDGEVYPCVSLNIPLGNIRQQPLTEIWQSHKAQEIRQLTRFSDPVCRVCPDQDFCNFCPGRSVLTTGDPTSPNAATCMTARVRRKTYEAQQANQIDGLLQPLPMSTATTQSSGCQQCSGGLQEKVDELLKQPSLFSPTQSIPAVPENHPSPQEPVDS